ncbi:hypothetical protein Tco_1049364 [Tanacetum coccineum]
METEEQVPVIKVGDQDEGQAGSNPSDATESQPQPSHVVHVVPNLEHTDLETTDASTQQKPKQIDEEFTTTAYPNVQENHKLLTEDHVILEEPASSTGTLSSLQNLNKDISFIDQFFMEKPQEEEPGKTNAEVQSMVLALFIKTPPHNNLNNYNNNNSSTTTTSKHHRSDPSSSYRLYKLENLNIPHQVSKVVDEIVTDAVDWEMQAPLRARFRDLITVDMKEILQQRMFEDNTYKTHEVHNDLYEALQKSVELDYSNQSLADQEETRKKKRKRRESPRTPLGSPPTQPPPPPPPAGASGALADIPGAQELSPTDYLMQDDSIPKEQVHLSDDENSENDHQPKADLIKDWWKPLLEEERPTTPEPSWTIPSTKKSDVVNNWASVLATTYEPQLRTHFEGQAYKVVKTFYPDVIDLQFQMDECHTMLTYQVDWTNLEGAQVRVDVNRPLPLCGPPGHVTIQT